MDIFDRYGPMANIINYLTLGVWVPFATVALATMASLLWMGLVGCAIVRYFWDVDGIIFEWKYAGAFTDSPKTVTG